MTTQTDKEEGFTGKSGFAYVEQIDFLCIGIDTVNDAYYSLNGDAPIWSTSLIENNLSPHEYPLGTGPRAIATFTYDNGVEVVDFPIFKQGDVLVRTGASFELAGVVRDSPMLYKSVDNNLKLTSTTGSNNFLPEFNVDVELVQEDGKVIRGFNYVDCRVVDYDIKTQRDKESSYWKGFVHQNMFDFECKGYHPNVPTYDAMFVVDKAQAVNTEDLRDTHSWDPGFYYEG